MKKLNLIFLSIMTSLLSISQNLYDIDNITLIEIEFSESDWDAILDQYYSNDVDERLVATSCLVNGVSFDSVGVKFKGNSTYSATNAKNPLNIKLNHILDQDYQGYNTFKLSNGNKDPSFVREVLSYEIGRKYMDMPLSNYAKVTINGDYYGLFSSSEAINGDYLERRFYSNRDNLRFKCNPVSTFTGISPSLEYLGADSSDYFDGYELKSDYGWADLVDFANQLSSNINNIENILDIDRAIWMLAFNNVLVNLDSYSGPFQQNYYLIKDDNGKFFPIVWDLNESIGGFSRINNGGGGPGSATGIDDLTDLDLYLRESDATFPLISKLLAVPRYKKMYTAHCKTMLEENFSNNNYYARAEFMQSVIETEVGNDPNAFYTAAQFTSNLDSEVTDGGGGGPGGGQGVFGISQVLGGRAIYLETLAEITANQPDITLINTLPSNVNPNSVVTFSVEITDANFAYLGYRDYIGDVFTKLELFDDGTHNDGAADDGVFANEIYVGSRDIQYYVYAENDDAGIFSPQRAEHEFHYLNINNDVVINEIMSINVGTVADQDGEFNDWVELYNNSGSSVDLAGYFLSDNESNLEKWQFPSGASIEANSYLIVWLDKDTLQEGLHANFKLSASGDDLHLSSPTVLISSVQIPLMESSTTFGRYPNGTGDFIRMRATHNAENSFTSVGIDENDKMVEVKVYPNPSSDFINITTDSKEKTTYYIYNLSGQVVLSGEFVNSIELNVREFNKGVYLINLPLLNEVKKIVVQ
jgi:hypothetical protein